MAAEIGFDVLSLDLVVAPENVGRDPDDFYEALETLGKLGFSENFCRILYEVYSQELLYILFHEYPLANPLYEEVTHEYDVFQLTYYCADGNIYTHHRVSKRRNRRVCRAVCVSTMSN